MAGKTTKTKATKAKVTAKKTVKPIKKTAQKVAKTRSVKKSNKIEAFAVVKDKDFMTFKITEQTIYWSILVAYIFLLSLWILRIQMDTLLMIDRVNSML